MKKVCLTIILFALVCSVLAASFMASFMSEESTTKVSSEPQNVDVNVERPIDPWVYQTLLGMGMDVDWSKTNQGRKYYNTQSAVDFAAAGISHV